MPIDGNEEHGELVFFFDRRFSGLKFASDFDEKVANSYFHSTNLQIAMCSLIIIRQNLSHCSMSSSSAAAAADAGKLSTPRTSISGPAVSSVSLSKEEEAEFREIFNLVDTDGGGSISKKELGRLMRTLNLQTSPQELDIMVEEIDKNNDGEIQFEEFVAVMAKKVRVSYSAQDVRKAFKVFESRDSNRPGHVDVASLTRALKVYSTEKLSAEQISELTKQLELVADRDGFVNYIDYLQMLMGD